MTEKSTFKSTFQALASTILSLLVTQICRIDQLAYSRTALRLLLSLLLPLIVVSQGLAQEHTARRCEGLLKSATSASTSATDPATKVAALTWGSKSNKDVPTFVGPDGDKVVQQRVGYHVMPVLLDGGFRRIEEEMADLPADYIWIGASDQQIPQQETYRTENGGRDKLTPNDHGYWPRWHGSFADELGGEEAFKTMLAKAQQAGKAVLTDAVIGHLGYGEGDHEFFFDGQWRKLDDLENTGVIRPNVWVKGHHWSQLDSLGDAQAVLNLQSEMSKLRLFGLPGFHHNREDVKRHMVSQYKKLIDMGVSGFRVDAVLYIDPEFMSYWINELNAYATAKGKEITFILETLIMQNELALNTLMQDLLKRIQDKDRIYFLDFPIMKESRRVADSSYDMHWFKSFLDYRKNNGVPAWRMIPTIINHDFGYVIQDPNSEKLVYAMAEFASFQPTMLFHGTEQSGRVTGNRQRISDIVANGDVANLVGRFRDALAPYRANHGSFLNPHYMILERHGLLAKKELEGRSIWLFANKEPMTRELTIDVPYKFKVVFHYSHGSAKLTVDGSECDPARVMEAGKHQLRIQADDHKALHLFEIVRVE